MTQPICISLATTYGKSGVDMSTPVHPVATRCRSVVGSVTNMDMVPSFAAVRLYIVCVCVCVCGRLLSLTAIGAGTNFESAGGTGPARKWGHRNIFCWSCPSTFLALKVQLVVLVSAFVMVSTAWFVCCSSTHGAPCAQPFVKVRG